jgi:DNA-binding transcriptional regulator YiaG
MLPTKEQIKAIRDKHGLSTSELARIIYVTDGAAHKWLSGERQMDQARWELLLYKLDGIEPPKPKWVHAGQGSLL